MYVLRPSDYRRMPWKNGGGETIEIAVAPEGAGMSDFDWRVSMARVDADGPFSTFPGIDRTLAILDGQGMVLTVGKAAPVTLLGSSPPHSFPADATTSASLIGGPVLDLNVMSRRGVLSHRVQRLDLVQATEIRLGGSVQLAFCTRGDVDIRVGSSRVGLSEGETLHRTGEAIDMVMHAVGAIVFLVELGPA